MVRKQAKEDVERKNVKKKGESSIKPSSLPNDGDLLAPKISYGTHLAVPGHLHFLWYRLQLPQQLPVGTGVSGK